MEQVKLKKLSVCPCGFALLNDSIPLGTEYTVDSTNTASATLICGGCGNHIKVTCVWADCSSDPDGAGYIPVEIFGLVASN